MVINILLGVAVLCAVSFLLWVGFLLSGGMDDLMDAPDAAEDIDMQWRDGE